MRLTTLFLLALLAGGATLALAAGTAGDAALGSLSYDAFEPDEVCSECHVDIARQHEQAMMSQSYVHHWDEIEYFELALPTPSKRKKWQE